MMLELKVSTKPYRATVRQDRTIEIMVTSDINKHYYDVHTATY